jgi:hypothetical protein
MMKQLRFAMWQGSHKVALREILEFVPDNGLEWRLLFLYASGSEWLGHASIGDLEEHVRGTPAGIAFSWAGLKSFASGLTDLHDCLVAAAPTNVTLRASEVRAQDYSSASIVIEGFDDRDWAIGAADEAMLDAMRARFGATA